MHPSSHLSVHPVSGSGRPNKSDMCSETLPKPDYGAKATIHCMGMCMEAWMHGGMDAWLHGCMNMVGWSSEWSPITQGTQALRHPGHSIPGTAGARAGCPMLPEASRHEAARAHQHCPMYKSRGHQNQLTSNVPSAKLKPQGIT